VERKYECAGGFENSEQRFVLKFEAEAVKSSRAVVVLGEEKAGSGGVNIDSVNSHLIFHCSVAWQVR
jgi:uncharacterized ferredoxin-like protein